MEHPFWKCDMETCTHGHVHFGNGKLSFLFSWRTPTSSYAHSIKGALQMFRRGKRRIRGGWDSRTYLTTEPPPFFWKIVFCNNYWLGCRAEVLNKWLSCVNGADSLYFPHFSWTFLDPGLFTTILTFLPFLSMISWTASDLIFIVLF